LERIFDKSIDLAYKLPISWSIIFFVILFPFQNFKI